MDKIKQVLSSPLSRRKSLQAQPKTFGVSLLDLASRSSSSSNIPFLVDRLCRFICAKGIDCEGIFRVNGNAKTAEKIKETFDKTGDADLDAIDDVMAVAGSLKQFLRELPESVVPESMTAQFIQTQEQCRQDKAECLKRMRSMLEGLPSVHYQVLKYIARFLIEVARKEAFNKMNMSSLGIVFGPSLFRCSGGIERLKDQGVANEIVYKFMLDYEELFGKLDEPMPFLLGDLTQEGQPPRHRNSAAPARPPPPRLASVDGGSYPSPRSRHSDGGGDEGQQPSPSPRFRASEDDFLERASPFTLADSDGTSTVASPILTAGASEIVSKAISSTVAELLFNPIKSAAPAGASNRNSTSSSPVAVAENADKGLLAKPSRRSYHQPSFDSSTNTLHDSVDSDGSSQASSEPVSSPKAPVSKPRAGHSATAAAATAKAAVSAGGGEAATASSTNLSNAATSFIARADEAAGRFSDLDAVTRQDAVLAVVRRPAGPSRRKQPRHLLSTPPSAAEAEKEENNNDIIGVDKLRGQLPASAAAAAVQGGPVIGAKKPNSGGSSIGIGSSIGSGSSSSGGGSWHAPVSTVVPIATAAAAAASDVPPLDLESLVGRKAASVYESSRSTATASGQLAVQQQQTTIANTVELSGTRAEGGGLPPGLRPKDEQQEISSKQLNRRIKDLKATIAEFEASYEVENGLKPSYQDKSAHPSIKKAMSELTKVRKEAKGLETQLQEACLSSSPEEDLDSVHVAPVPGSTGGSGSGSSHDGNNRLNRMMPPEAAATAASGGRTKKPLVVARPGGARASGDAAQQLQQQQPPAPKEAMSMRHTLDLLMRRLRDKRLEGGRPEELGKMTREQAQDEKLCVQKALLHFEGYHGRPSSKADKELMKPLYDRYRQVKQIITASSWNTSSMLGGSTDMASLTVTMDTTQQLSLPKKTGNGQVRLSMSAASDDPPVPAADIVSNSMEHASLQSMSSQELLKEQSKTLAEKRKLHQVLRTFEDNFTNEHGRAVQKEDRVHMKSQYREYKYIKSKLRLIEHLLAKHGPAAGAAAASS